MLILMTESLQKPVILSFKIFIFLKNFPFFSLILKLKKQEIQFMNVEELCRFSSHANFSEF